MAGWGIGLGSFVSGMQSGYGLGQRIQHNRQASEMNEMKLQDMRRARQQRQEFEAIGRQGKADFDAAVSRGQADPSHPDEWFSQNYAPRMESFYLSRGDVENAAKWNKWASDSNTKKQIRMMGGVLGQLYDGANTGDYSGLEAEMGKFFKTLPKEMQSRMGKFDGLRAETDETGRFNATASFTDSKGKEHIYQFDSPDQLRQTIEGWANPTALFSETMKDAESAKKFKANLAEYKAKKDIDFRHSQDERAAGLKGKTPQERYAAAQEVLTKASIDGKPPSDADVRAYLKSQDDYALTVAPGISAQPVETSAAPAEVAAQPAAAVPGGKSSAGKIIVNQKTGEPVAGAGGSDALPMPTTPASITAPPPSGSPAQEPAQPAAPPPSGPQGVAIGIGLPALLARSKAAPAPTASGIAAQPTAVAAVAGSKGQPLYLATQQPPEGMVRQGNIDLSRRPTVKNADGSISTVRSITVTIPGGRAVLIPTVVGGRVVSNQEAIKHFQQTGENLGVFRDEASADQYANALHEQQAQAYLPKGR